MSEYSLYLLRCRDGSLYTGIATDVERRLAEHDSGPRGAKYLRGRGPLRLEFVRPIGDRSAASRAERRVKGLSRTDKEALLSGELTLADLLSDAESTQASGAGGG